jgi:hypothetical protein
LTRIPGDFFAGAGFRATTFRESGFLGAGRFAGVAFFAVLVDDSLPLGGVFAFAIFRPADFRGTALVAFGRLVVEVDERRLAADFGEAR